MRVLRRFLILVAVLLLPLYALSWSERLVPPAAWYGIAVGDSHAEVRARLRASGLADTQCEWIASERSVRCTLLGDHRACGVAILFDGADGAARVARVRIHEAVYTGPFHLHARLRRYLR